MNEPRITGDSLMSERDRSMSQTQTTETAVTVSTENEDSKNETLDRISRGFDHINRSIARTRFEAALLTGELHKHFATYRILDFSIKRAKPAGLIEPSRYPTNIVEVRDYSRRLMAYAEQLAETGDELAIKARDTLNSETELPIYDPYPYDIEGETKEEKWERLEKQDERKEKMQHSIVETERYNDGNEQNIDLYAITSYGGFLGDEFSYRSNTEEVLYDALGIEDAKETNLSILEIAAGKTPLSRSILTDGSHATYIDPLYRNETTSPRERAIPGTAEELNTLLGDNKYDLVLAKRLFGAPIDMDLETTLNRVPTQEERQQKATEILSDALSHLREGGLIFARNDEPFPAPLPELFEKHNCEFLRFGAGGLAEYWLIRKRS